MAVMEVVTMYVFGITGGVGAGKSTVLRLIKENFNASVIEADEVGRMLMEPGNGAYLKIVEIFGEDILDNPGEQGSPINRAKLAGIVFNNKNKRMVLNGIVHPLVKKYITEEIGRIRCAEKYDYVFVEAALLIEDHYDIICDELWYIYADEETRRERLKSSRGYSDEKIDSLFASQLSDEQFRSHCSRVIDNSHDEQMTLGQLKEIIGYYD